MGTGGEAWLQGGAALTLVIFVAAVMRELLRDNRTYRDDIKTLQKEKEDLLKSSVELLRTHQSRDAEDLRYYREQERRRASGPSP